MSIAIGTYAPNQAGATSLRDAKPLYVGYDKVTAAVYDMGDGPRLAIHVGCKMPYEGPIPEGVNHSHELFDWIREFVAPATVAEESAPAPAVKAERTGRDYTGMTETEIANLKSTKYLAAFVDANYGMPYDDREHELIKSVEHAKRELWSRAVRNQGRSRYVDTAPDLNGFSFFPCVTDDAEIMLYAFEVVNGEIQRDEYPSYRVFMGPRGGIKAERVF
jgi:hypothetical protein